jgi:protein TonB
MTALALSWIEDDEPRDLMRWGIAAALVLGTHAAVVAGFLLFHQPEELDNGSPVAFVDLAPIDSTPDAQQSDLAPAPEAMVESKPTEVEKPPEDKFELAPPPEVAPTIVPEEIQKPEEEKVEEVKPPSPQTTAPARAQSAGRAIAPAWRDRLIAHLQRFKRYPSSAQSRGEQGVVVLSFSIDRNGHVLARRVSNSSGYPELDEEVMSMIERAQPLPAFPASMTQTRLDLTVPIRFSIR